MRVVPMAERQCKPISFYQPNVPAASLVVRQWDDQAAISLLACPAGRSWSGQAGRQFDPRLTLSVLLGAIDMNYWFVLTNR